MNEMKRLPIKDEMDAQAREDCRLRLFGALAFLGAMFAIAFAFNVWLDAGCDLTGIITWQGKECI